MPQRVCLDKEKIKKMMTCSAVSPFLDDSGVILISLGWTLFNESGISIRPLVDSMNTEYKLKKIIEY
jgi:hypothetical protein